MKRLVQMATLGALLAAAPVMVACDRGPDVKEQVSQSLDQANIDNVNLDWDDDAKVLHLKGSVNSPAERERAEQVATAAVGTSGTVLNELTIEGLNDQSAGDMDGEIRDRLHEMLENDATLKERDIDFDVNNGVVKITGEVQSAAEKNRVGEIVKAAPGVKDFANALEIEGAKAQN